MISHGILTFWYCCLPIWLLKSYRKPIIRPNYCVEVSGNRNSPGFKPKSHFTAREQYQSVKIEKDSSASIKIEKGEFSFDFIDKGGKICEGFFYLFKKNELKDSLVVWFGFFENGLNWKYLWTFSHLLLSQFQSDSFLENEAEN